MLTAPKGVSLALLGLLFLTAVALTGSTVFFQQRFDNINTAYQEKLVSLQKVSSDLDAQQAALEKVQEELELKTKREEEFSQKYTEVKGVKETLEQQLARLENEKVGLQASLTSVQILLNNTNASLQSNITKVLEQETRIRVLQKDVNKCEDDLQTCCGS